MRKSGHKHQPAEGYWNCHRKAASHPMPLSLLMPLSLSSTEVRRQMRKAAESGMMNLSYPHHREGPWYGYE
jgi:hypothetical protein